MTLTSPATAPRTHPYLVRLAVTVGALAVAGGVFLLAVWTAVGQLVDQRLYDYIRGQTPDPSTPSVLLIDVITEPLSWLAVAAAVAVLCWPRRRSSLWAVGALLIFGPLMIVTARVLRDDILTRPTLLEAVGTAPNSAPSGHAAAAMACAVVLVRAAPPVLRRPLAIVVGAWAAVVEYGLIAAGWHRPSDVIISTLLVLAVGALLPDPHRADAASRTRVPAGWLVMPTIVVGALAGVVFYYRPGVAGIAVTVLLSAVVGAAMLIISGSAAMGSATRSAESPCGPATPVDASVITDRLNVPRNAAAQPHAGDTQVLVRH